MTSNLWFQLHISLTDQPDRSCSGGQAQTLTLLIGYYNDDVSATTTLTEGEIDQSCADARENGAKGSQFYLDLSTLNLGDAINQLQLNSQAWQYKVESQTLCFTPKNDITLSASSPSSLTSPPSPNPQSSAVTSLSLTLNNATLPDQSNGHMMANVNISYYLALPQQLSLPKKAFHDVIQGRLLPMRPSQGLKSLQDVLRITLDPYLILNTPAKKSPPNVRRTPNPAKNALTLKFSSVDGNVSTVPVNENTYFKLYFAVGELTDADASAKLLTPEQLDSHTPTVSQSTEAQDWYVDTPEGTLYYWKLTPPTGYLFGPKGTYSPTFDIEDLVTFFPPGATLARVESYNVPDYPDAVYIIPLQKYPQADIESFTGTEALIYDYRYRGALNTAAQLTWSTRYATTLTLNPPADEDVTGMTSFASPIDSNTTFTLVAKGESHDNMIDNRATGTATVTVNKFTASNPVYIVCQTKADPENLSVITCDGQHAVFSKPVPLAPTANTPLINPRAIYCNTHLYLFGGLENNAVGCIRYDGGTATLEKTIEGISTRAGVAPFQWNQKLYLAFADASNNNILACVSLDEDLSVQGPPWTEQHQIASREDFSVCTASDGYPYIFGNVNGSLKAWTFNNGIFEADVGSLVNLQGSPGTVEINLGQTKTPWFFLVTFFCGTNGELSLCSVPVTGKNQYGKSQALPVGQLSTSISPYAIVVSTTQTGNTQMVATVLVIYADRSATLQAAIVQISNNLSDSTQLACNVITTHSLGATLSLPGARPDGFKFYT